MEINEIYKKIKKDITKKQKSFDKNWIDGDDLILKELYFCLCTPQSNAKNCWKAIQNLPNKLINKEQIEEILGTNGVRFKKNKASYLIEAYSFFKNHSIRQFLSDKLISLKVNETRNWLAKNVKGFGMKEASHFLRNIGLGNHICILDRHILRNLKEQNVIQDYDRLDTKKYLMIEDKMKDFAHEKHIPVFALDFVFWYKAKGELFK